MTDISGKLKPLASLQRSLQDLQRTLSGGEPERLVVGMATIGIVGDAITEAQVEALSGLFTEMRFEHLGPTWQDRYPRHVHILFVPVDAGDQEATERAVRRLAERAPHQQIGIVLRNANIPVSRALSHAGAADVLPFPPTDAALALSIERLLSDRGQDRAVARKPGQVVAVLKAGGGVGATSLAVQAAIQLAARAGEGKVCFADLDLQFGVASTYFDLPEAITVTDCIGAGEHLSEAQFATALTPHASGVRLLAGPRELTALDALTPHLADSLVAGLRRDFALSIVDLPAVWTAWTNRTLQLSDRIVLVTRLSVANVHLVRRQLSVLALQKLDEIPITLVCNAVTPEQQRLLDIKDAERALGRRFRIILPSDERVMIAATNEGRPVASLRRGTKLESGITALANEMAADALAGMSAVSRQVTR